MPTPAEIQDIIDRERSVMLLAMFESLMLTHIWTEAGIIPIVGLPGAEGLEWRGPWATDAVYLIDDAVELLGSSYMCIEAHVASVGNQPPGAFWELLVQKGTTGAQGPPGSQGSQGIPGNDGPQGLQGVSGAQGPTGSQGLQGVPGNDGDDGQYGTQGPPGATGPQGVPGNDGPQGPVGQNGPPGQDGTAGEDGAQGPPGSQGSQGIQGNEGIQGVPGSQGSQGPQGVPGNDGDDGQDGTQGIAGAQGPPGSAGPVGPQGIPGQPGEDGTDGEQGPTGATGPQGPAGGGGATATTVETNIATANWQGRFTITDAAISASSKVLCWQAPGPYTGKGTRADEAAMQPVNVVAVAPASGSAVVYWETPPIAAFVVDAVYNSINALTIGKDGWISGGMRRRSKARGNIKFSYAVFA